MQTRCQSNGERRAVRGGQSRAKGRAVSGRGCAPEAPPEALRARRAGVVAAAGAAKMASAIAVAGRSGVKMSTGHLTADGSLAPAPPSSGEAVWLGVCVPRAGGAAASGLRLVARALVALAMLAVGSACSPTAPASGADDVGARTAEAPPAPDSAHEPAPSRSTPEVGGARTEGRTAGEAAERVHLVRHSGSLEGPIPYLVVEPSRGADALPIVIALHGRGDTAEGFAGLAEQLGLPLRTVVARAPLRYGGRGGRQWFESGATDEAAQVRARAQELATLAEQLAARYPGSPPPALYGFSQGAVVALQAAADLPQRWSAVAALSGYLAAGDAEPVGAPLPLLVVAGSRDGVIPPTRSWEAADRLEELGHRPSRFAFDGPHRVPPEVVARLAAFLGEHLLAGAAPE